MVLARAVIPWGYIVGMEMKGSGSTKGVDSRGSPLSIGMVALPVWGGDLIEDSSTPWVVSGVLKTRSPYNEILSRFE